MQLFKQINHSSILIFSRKHAARIIESIFLHLGYSGCVFSTNAAEKFQAFLFRVTLALHKKIAARKEVIDGSAKTKFKDLATAQFTQDLAWICTLRKACCCTGADPGGGCGGCIPPHQPFLTML